MRPIGCLEKNHDHPAKTHCSMHHRAQALYMMKKLGLENLPEGDVFSWENSGKN